MALQMEGLCRDLGIHNRPGYCHVPDWVGLALRLLPLLAAGALGGPRAVPLRGQASRLLGRGAASPGAEWSLKEAFTSGK